MDIGWHALGLVTACVYLHEMSWFWSLEKKSSMIEDKCLIGVIIISSPSYKWELILNVELKIGETNKPQWREVDTDKYAMVIYSQ